MSWKVSVQQAKGYHKPYLVTIVAKDAKGEITLSDLEKEFIEMFPPDEVNNDRLIAPEGDVVNHIKIKIITEPHSVELEAQTEKGLDILNKLVNALVDTIPLSEINDNIRYIGNISLDSLN